MKGCSVPIERSRGWNSRAMSSFRLLNLVKPFLSVLPEVSAPDRKVSTASLLRPHSLTPLLQ